MSLNFFEKYIPVLLQATRHTINLAVISLVISLILAVIIASIVYYQIKIITPILELYVSFFRGTPALCQLYLIYFGLGTTNIPILSNMSAYGAAIAALSLNMSAYMAENLRGALSSVDKGQYEAGLSIGLSNYKIFSHIIFPQAFRVSIPSLSNGFIDLIKGSSIAFTVGVGEMMAAANLAGSATYNYLGAFIIASVLYWLLNLVVGRLQRVLENKLNKVY